MTSSRWPEPVRDPLPTGMLNEQDIQDALFLCIQHSREPEDPEFDPTTHGALGAASAALMECAEVLNLNRISRETLTMQGMERHPYHELRRAAEDVIAFKIARKVINELRQWLPEVTYDA